MLGCDRTATLVQRIEDGDRDLYTCTALYGVSWFAKTVTEQSESGAKPVSILKCRVPAAVMPAEICPKPGDFLVLGELKHVESLADLLEWPYFQITAVGDNRRGRLAHWSLNGV